MIHILELIDDLWIEHTSPVLLNNLSEATDVAYTERKI